MGCSPKMPSRRARLRRLLVLALLPLALACAAKRPVLYPDAHYRSMGIEVAEQDVYECIEFAKHEVGREPAGAKMAKGAAVGGAVGGAAGGVAGAIRGGAGSRAGAGAAAGATVGLLGGIFRSRDPDPLFRNFVQICLADRGYRIIGWR